MLTCKQASHLLSAKLDRHLSLGERLGLRLHLAICDACAKVDSQLRFLRRALSRYPGPDGDDAGGR